MLYSFGSNGRGQLSLAHQNDVHTPTRCITSSISLPSTRPKRIVAGGNHTQLLFPTGELFAVGDNTYSQCIPQDTASPQQTLLTFHPVPVPPSANGWDLVSAGWNFTIAVSNGYGVFVSGHGPKGELGLGAEKVKAEWEQVRGFPPEGQRVERIESCMAHTVAVLSNGEVYGWGAGRKGQLGSPVEMAVCTPRKIEMEWGVEWAVCGREFTFLVERVRDPGLRRRVKLVGSDRFGVRDGVGGWLEEFVVDVQASWNSVYVKYDDGRLVGFGRNDRGQLPPEDLGFVQQFAVGSEHVVAVVDRKLVAWGWGEHGNCGKSRDETGGGDVVGVVEEVKILGIESVDEFAGSRGHIRAVGAGCATSWVWAGR